MGILWANVKLYVIGVVVLALLGGFLWYGHHERAVGASSVQVKWDASKLVQASLAASQSESARVTETKQAGDFANIESNYLQATKHEEPTFDLSAGLANGTVRLRYDCPAVHPGEVSRATAASRSLDAAATQALADRVASSIRIVSAAQQADRREAQLGAQVTGLQDLLKAERKP